MSIPRVNPRLMSAAARANYERMQASLGFVHKDNFVQSSVGGVPRRGHQKKTLTPDMADNLVKSVKVSEDGNIIQILLAVNPSQLPTAQQKGAFVGKDGKVHFFTKGKVAKAGKALAKALAPYAKMTERWGKVPIQFTFDSYFQYPTGTPKKDLHKIGPHLERPDGDNLLKLPADILTEVGFWCDDCVIDTYVIRKRRTTGPACIKMTIENLQPKFEALFRETEEYAHPTLFKKQDSLAKPAETNPLSDMLDGKHTPTP